jgi:methionyl-tRNA formyltransferase
MRLVFMGTPDFAVPSLRALKDEHEIFLVVTQPDRPAGRGRKLSPPPVKVEALKSGIPVIQTDNANDPDVLAQIQEMRPQVIVVVAYGCILKKALLRTPSMAPVNLHASLLPKYRGMSPINRVIMDGRKTTGVTTMKMDAGVDTGPILLQKRIKIGPTQTAGELSDVLAEVGAELLLETVNKMEAGKIRATPQDDSKSSYAKRLRKSDGVVPWNRVPATVVNHVRGVTPWPGATTYIDGAVLKLLETAVVVPPKGLEAAIADESGKVNAAIADAQDKVKAAIAKTSGMPNSANGIPGKVKITNGIPGDALDAEPGTVVAVTDTGPIVAARDGLVVLRTVCPQGKKPMSGASWARGKRDLIGRKFSTEI